MALNLPYKPFCPECMAEVEHTVASAVRDQQVRQMAFRAVDRCDHDQENLPIGGGRGKPLPRPATPTPTPTPTPAPPAQPGSVDTLTLPLGMLPEPEDGSITPASLDAKYGHLDLPSGFDAGMVDD